MLYAIFLWNTLCFCNIHTDNTESVLYVIFLCNILCLCNILTVILNQSLCNILMHCIRILHTRWIPSVRLLHKHRVCNKNIAYSMLMQYSYWLYWISLVCNILMQYSMLMQYSHWWYLISLLCNILMKYSMLMQYSHWWYWISLLCISDHPKVQKFSFPDQVVTGQRTSATCTAVSGTPPMDFKWFKNGQIIKSSQQFTIRTSSDYSILFIENVDRSTSGNYTCELTTLSGTDQYTTLLEVKGKVFFY